MNKIKTVIVDDEARIRRGIERMVRANGEEFDIVGTFSDGTEAIRFLKESRVRINLLITDVKMPEMDGLQTIKETKRGGYQDDTFHSIIVSGYDDLHYLLAAIREGTFDYVLKPIDREQFDELIQRVKRSILEQLLKIQEWDDLKKNANKLAYSQEIRQLSEAVASEPEDVSSLYWITDFPAGLYQLLFVSVDEFPVKTREYSPKDWGVMSYAIQNIMGEMVEREAGREDGSRSWWWSGGGFHFWTLRFIGDQEEHEFMGTGKRFAEELKSNINRYTPFSVSIACSDSFRDLSMLPNLRKELQALMHFRMLYGGNQVFSPGYTDDLSSKDVKALVSVRVKETALQLVSALGLSSLAEIEKLFGAFFAEMKKLQLPSEIHDAIRYFAFQVYKVGLEHRGSGIDLSEIDDVYAAIKSKSTLNQMQVLVKQVILPIHERLLAYRLDKVQDPVFKAKAWISENVDRKITIKAISDHVYMNSTYFCEYFKNQTGETILDYVTNVRLDKARELILNTDLKISEISQRLGYQDPKYFSKLFKRKWGLLPSDLKRN